jgi:hypothetical protein
LTTAKIRATIITWKSDDTIRDRPGRSARDEYSPERANSRTVTRYAKAIVLRVSSYDASHAQSPKRSTALTISAT